MGPRAGRPTRPGAGWRSIRGSIAIRACVIFAAVFALNLPLPAWAAEAGGFLPFDLLMTLIVAAAGALAVAGGLWGLAEHRNSRALRDSLRATTAKARALLSARDAWLAAGRESLMVWSSDGSAPLSFGDGAVLMEACLTGPDATNLSTALDALSASGTAFTL